MKKIIVALMFLNLSLPLIANENFPSFEEYFKNKISDIKVIQNDRMEIIYKTGWAIRQIGQEGLIVDYFGFKNIKVNLFKEQNDFILFTNKKHKFIEFINAAGGEAEKKLNDYYKFIEEQKADKSFNIQNYNTEVSRKKMQKYGLIHKKLIEEIIIAFNKQISTNEEVHEKVSKVYQKYLMVLDENLKEKIRDEYNTKYKKIINENKPSFDIYYKNRIQEIKVLPEEIMSIVLRPYFRTILIYFTKRQNLFPDYFEFKKIKIYLFDNSDDFILFEKKQHKFNEFINAAGGEAERKLNSYYKFIEDAKKDKRLNIEEPFASSYKENLQEFHQTSNSKFEEIVRAFNDQISNSEEARKSVLKVYLKYSKEEEKNAIREEYDEKYGRNPILLHAFVGMGLAKYNLRAVERQAGLRFNYYFSDQKADINVGLLFEVGYIVDGDLGYNYDKDAIGATRKYLGFNLGLSFKLNLKQPHSSLHFALGFTSLIKIDGIDSYTGVYYTDTSTFYYKKFVPAISLNLEYLFTAQKSGFSFFVGLFLMFGFTNPYDEYRNGVKQEASMYYTIGARGGFGFNLN